MPVEISSNVNPLVGIQTHRSFPLNLEPDFYSNLTEDVILSDRTITLDLLQDDERNLKEAGKAIAAFRKGDSEKHFLEIAPIWFLQAGHALFQLGQYEKALQAFLNSCRLEPVGDRISPFMRRNIGKCLQELGGFSSAGSEYLMAAEGFLEENKSADAADCFERTGLAWEAVKETTRPALGTENGHHNSTLCFRKAKYLYLNLGDYSASSRCSILEQDSIARWSPSRLTKLTLHAMRAVWLYGESPLYVFRSLLLLLIGVATMFFYFGFQHGNDLISYHFTFCMNSESIADFGNALYLAAITISTLGYGDYFPASGVSKAVAGVASFCGVLVAAMLIVSLQRRFVGR